jgi:aspartyl-tRNA(Asn)/glutamyl-tRNA(Gln) amidotransferase subunit A
VAAREVWGTLGSDPGGSIRQPAAFTNTVGLKPTYGRVSRYGLVAHASSLDQVGPMARTVADAAALLQAIAGHDARDATSLAAPVPDLTPLHPGRLAGLRLGLPREWLEAGLDAEVEAVLQEAVRVYARLGARVEEVHLPHTPQALAAYYVLAPAEASSNLARFDGVRYGLRAPGADTLERLYSESRALGLGPEVKRRILLGTHALSAGARAALYQRAQAVRARVRAELEQVLNRVDVLLSPTCPVPAFPLGAVREGWDMYRMDALTVPCSLAGLPGLSLPGGFTRAGLPVGLQLVARPLEEALLLQVAQAFERECPHHLRAPAP